MLWLVIVLLMTRRDLQQYHEKNMAVEYQRRFRKPIRPILTAIKRLTVAVHLSVHLHFLAHRSGPLEFELWISLRNPFYGCSYMPQIQPDAPQT